MKYRKLGRTDIDVSVICLGSMTWGEQNTQDQAFQQLDFALGEGVNFIDTAEMYAVPPRKETYGLTECYIGHWLAARKNRDKIILATKAVGKSDRMPYIRDGKACLNKKNIQKACEDSLKRLQTDYIDLYQLHWPDRETNFFGQHDYHHNPESFGTPLEETLEAVESLQKEGKIRHFGLSNETPWGTMKYLELSQKHNLPRPVSIQNPYSLLNRLFEVGLSEVAIREQCGLLAYSPTAFGVLSGKYLNGNRPANARLTLFPAMTRYMGTLSGTGNDIVERYVNIAKSYNLSPIQLCLAFVNERPFVTSNIIGATSMEQLKENIDSIHVSIPPEAFAEIQKLHLERPNPCP